MSADPGRLEVYCHDVGQGDCTIIVPPHGEGDPILFDCADPYVAERFFANHRMKRLEAVVGSHLDVDHVGGLLPFLRQHFAKGHEVGKLVLGIDRDDLSRTATDLVEAALAWDKDPPHAGFQLLPPFRSGAAPLRLSSGNGWSIDLVLPFWGTKLESQYDGDAANLASAVLRVERAGAVVLIGGDAPLGSWERLDEGRRRANTIRAPHHGGEIREGGRSWKRFEDLYDAVKADRAILSVGSNNPYGHPFQEHVVAMRRGKQCRVACTQMTTQCHGRLLKVRGDGLTMASEIEYPYRHRAEKGIPSASPRPPAEVPCAGTVLVSIDSRGTVFMRPRPKEHDELLDMLDHPMCRD